jgi:hypothetical protein
MECLVERSALPARNQARPLDQILVGAYVMFFIRN